MPTKSKKTIKPNMPLRDSRGHFVKKQITKQVPPKPHIKGSKIIPPAGLLETIAKPKQLSPEERIKLLESEMSAVKTGMNLVQQSTVNMALSHTQKISEVKEGLDKHHKHLTYLEDISSKPVFGTMAGGMGITDTQHLDGKKDRAILDYASAVKHHLSDAYPLNSNTINKIAERYAKKSLFISLGWLVYVGAIGVSIASNSIPAIFAVVFFGGLIAVTVSFAIWRE
jgi:hypothetical protein